MLGKQVDDEGEEDEPEVCARRQMEIDWACTWLGDGGMPAMAEGQAQGLLCQVLFPLLPASSHPYSILGIWFLPSWLQFGF